MLVQERVDDGETMDRAHGLAAVALKRLTIGAARHGGILGIADAAMLAHQPAARDEGVEPCHLSARQ